MDAEQSLDLASHAAPIDSSPSLDEKPQRPKSRLVRRHSRLVVDLGDGARPGLLAVWALLILALLGVVFGYTLYTTLHRDDLCTGHTSVRSATLRNVTILYEDKRFDGEFMHENMYRQAASAAVDEAWRALGIDLRPGVIAAKYGAESGLTDAHVQVADEYGGGFIVNVEGMHHLHCLDLLRQGLWFNFDHYSKLRRGAFGNDKRILQLHMSHCLDTLRQVLMCNVDTGVLGQVWVADQRGGAQAFPDFGTTHRCKNYEDVRAFAERIQAPPPDELPDGYLKSPRGEQVLPFTP